ncbi:MULTISPECIES: hypothetical protein [Pectobacterium]|uniref:hypothetical protein n=1 Tax=Pectobacterium TaxID=122277 RepID=UPI0015DFE58C|nr:MULTISPECIES: hypothetical protein [Pectobacterium]MBA0177014.1 hypothetical protein [Pectobacterium carotovorum]MCY9848245.1 hypothetical protein [Pectobacterium jejuense]
MKITKDEAMSQIKIAFKRFHVEFIDPESTAIRVRIFFDENRLQSCSVNDGLLPVIPRENYSSQERLDVCIADLKGKFNVQLQNFMSR